MFNRLIMNGIILDCNLNVFSRGQTIDLKNLLFALKENKFTGFFGQIPSQSSFNLIHAEHWKV